MDFIDTTEKKFVIKNCRRIYRQSIKRHSPPLRRKKLTVLEITYGGDNIIMVSLPDKSNSLNPKDDASI